MHKPIRSFVFALALFGFLALLGLCFPEQGISIAGYYTLRFPSTKDLLEPAEKQKDITRLLKAIDAIDTNFTVVPIKPGKLKHTSDSMPLVSPPASKPLKPSSPERIPELITVLQSRNGKALYRFYEALSSVQDFSTSIRVLHYGDSQIEGDRITDYLRLKLQAQFGGEGPGLISSMPLSQSVVNRIEYSTNWERFSTYTGRDRRVKHNNYGILAGFTRFLPAAGTEPLRTITSASIGIVTRPQGGGNALNFSKIKMFYGGSRTRTWCEFYEGPALMKADSLEAGGVFRVKEFKIVSGTNRHVFRFRGKDSPDLYSLSLEGSSGVMVDNIALRGSSGTFFHQINPEQLKAFFSYLNVKLIILQFGGNVMPSLLNDSMAVNYGQYLKYQISMVQKAAPGVSILFIGPSDMAIKEGTEYVTYPLLEKVRDEIKAAVLESNCAFFDLYDCMGGRNSMAAWVEQNLAASDYIHFSPQGARKMAIMLYSAIINDYNNYLSKQPDAKP
ncbi:MAG TPA: GDSL-type esterase/lipase family protein [Bacteroidia bacterium]|nr:GDSL-type esterase/lipase family protein [Bacteroidia bacterium]